MLFVSNRPVMLLVTAKKRHQKALLSGGANDCR